MASSATGTAIRLSITRIDIKDFTKPGELLLDLEENAAVAVQRARAWAQVRGYDSLVPTMERTLGGEPPQSGFSITINKPYNLLIVATWPWAPPSIRP